MARYKYNELYGKICAVCGTISEFASELDKTPDTISAKLKGRSPWKACEIDKACEILSIKREEIPVYFFKH